MTWHRFVEVRGEDDCWPWRGCRGGSLRYGQVRRGPSTRYAHRVAYALHHGVDERSLDVVMHTCDNPVCCNPAHLRHGTQAENLQDAIDKGRRTYERAKR